MHGADVRRTRRELVSADATLSRVPVKSRHETAVLPVLFFRPRLHACILLCFNMDRGVPERRERGIQAWCLGYANLSAVRFACQTR